MIETLLKEGLNDYILLGAIIGFFVILLPALLKFLKEKAHGVLP